MRSAFVVVLALVLAACLVASSGVAQQTDATDPPDLQSADPAATPALVVEKGSVARRQVVALDRDVRIAGQALSDVAAIGGSVWIDGTVDGDVIVMTGDAHLGPEARIGGDLFVVGGAIDNAPGSTVDGRMVASASSAWVMLFEGPALGMSATDPVVLGAKLALLAAWMVLALLLFAVSGREMLATSATVAREPLRSFTTGLVGVLALVLTAVLTRAVTAPLVGVPLLVLVMLALLALKLWGMVAIFHALGSFLAARVSSRRLLVLNAVTLGLVVLGVVKLVPLVGSVVWTLATFIGVGATLSSKFGREEAWFHLAELDGVVTQRS